MNRFRIAVSCILLLGTFVLLQFHSSGEAVPIRAPLKAFPASFGGWNLVETGSLDQKTLDVLKVKDYLTNFYTGPGGRKCSLYIGYWDTQRQGAQIHSPKNCLPGAGWEPVETKSVTIPLPAPFSQITANSYLIQKDRNQQLVIYWFQSAGTVSASEIEAKVRMVKNSILFNRSDGAIIRVTSPIYGSVNETSELQVQFIQSFFPALSGFLPD